MLNLAKDESWKAAGCGGQLQALIDRPEVRALIEADPQVARLLRPLMWALGQSMAVVQLGLRDGALTQRRRPAAPVLPFVHWIDPPDVAPPVTHHGCVVFGYRGDPTNPERRIPIRYRET